jgi:hypothetical protein
MGRKMMTFIDDQMAIGCNTVIHNPLPHQTLDKSNIQLAGPPYGMRPKIRRMIL